MLSHSDEDLDCEEWEYQYWQRCVGHWFSPPMPSANRGLQRYVIHSTMDKVNKLATSRPDLAAKYRELAILARLGV